MDEKPHQSRPPADPSDAGLSGSPAAETPGSAALEDELALSLHKQQEDNYLLLGEEQRKLNSVPVGNHAPGLERDALAHEDVPSGKPESTGKPKELNPEMQDQQSEAMDEPNESQHSQSGTMGSGQDPIDGVSMGCGQDPIEGLPSERVKDDPIVQTDPVKSQQIEPDPIPTPLSEKECFPPGYRLAPALKLPLEHPEVVSCFACHDANLYIGTSLGNVLHLYLFEDAAEYMLIMQLSVNDRPVQKIVLLPDAEVCLVLCNNNISAYTFPELLPCHIGKIRDVQDFLVLSQGQKSGSVQLDKIIVYTQAKIRLVQILKTSIKLLKDINYVDAKTGVSSACSAQSNYSKICVVANLHSYEVVDMQKPQKIPLFAYNPASVPAAQPYILPFTTSDGNEEYVLPVCTDTKSSMAMFTNSSGDATRGTLTWPEMGYPAHGMAVEWPYVFGLFKNGSCTQCVTSSLQTLATVNSCNAREAFGENPRLWGSQGVRVFDEHLSLALAPVYYVSGAPHAGAKSYFHKSHVVISSGTALHCLVKPSLLAGKIEALMQDVPSDVSPHKEYFLAQEGHFCESIYLAILAMTEDFDRLKTLVTPKTDVRSLLLFSSKNVDETDPFWASYTLPKVVRELLLKWRIRPTCGSYKFYSEKSKSFLLWLFQYVSEEDKFDESVREKFREFTYTMGCQNSAEIIEKLHSETDSWLGQNSVNNKLTHYFEESHFYVAIIEVYLIKQAAGNPFLLWDVKIIDICLNLLSGKCQNSTVDETLLAPPNITIRYGVSTKTYNLSELICTQLNRISDEKDYTKKVLDFVALRAEEGLVFLQKNQKSRFRSAHKDILLQVSKSLEFDSNFPYLKAQYLEQSFGEMMQNCPSYEQIDMDLASDLFDEYVQFLGRKGLEMEYENLNILFLTFKLENDLADPNWPKLTWMEFLALTHHNYECKDFLRVWLKLNELLLLFLSKRIRKSVAFKYNNEATEYLHMLEDITYLLGVGDYTAAEHSALYAVPPLPRQPVLLQIGINYSLRAEAECVKSLHKILSFYLEKKSRNCSVMHLVNDFGLFFDMHAILDSLPVDFPLMYVENFFMIKLVDLEEKRVQSSMTKILAKTDAKRSAKVTKEYEKIVSYLESLNLPSEKSESKVKDLQD